MEGFLNKKARGDSNFGRRNWKRRWFILEGRTLSYYEDIDFETGELKSKKGEFDLTECEVLPTTHRDKKNSFAIRSKKDNNKVMHLQADDPKNLSTWMKAISQAIRGELLQNTINLKECYEILNLDIEENPSASEISRAYRKAALKVHPDKGGDLDKFKYLQEAFNTIMSKLEEEEERKKFIEEEITVNLVKGPFGVGVGLVVKEDIAKKHLIIKEIVPEIQILEISANANGKILPGDLLIKVKNEYVGNLPLLRVAQKLSDYRVPVGGSVKLTLLRKIPIDPSNTEDQHFETASNDEDFDRDHRWDDDKNIDSNEEKARPTSLYSHMDPVEYVAVKAENEELRSDLDCSLKELQRVNKEKDDLLNDIAYQKSQVEKYKSMLSESMRRQKYLELQLEKALVNDQITNEKMAQSVNEMNLISQALTSGGDISASKEIDEYLSTHEVKPEIEANKSLMSSYKKAVAATGMLDKTGSTLEKWSLSGDSAMDKLARFEERMKNFKPSSDASDLVDEDKSPNKTLLQAKKAKTSLPTFAKTASYMGPKNQKSMRPQPAATMNRSSSVPITYPKRPAPNPKFN